MLRLLRIFRLLKLASYVQEYFSLAEALIASRRKILIFFSVVFIIVFLHGTMMDVVEGPENGFTSIPASVYWAITALTTVGFGESAERFSSTAGWVNGSELGKTNASHHIRGLAQRSISVQGRP